ncbi:MAG: tRNA threonylcarbamoyladenosine dehydratase [Methylophilaceae bacterium]|nr:tRNA threonylcarbamoyladenosine dehydratase [Methylophilaceae bacterium]MBL6726328.1 tRNA threonylcarbamoyladenosine dehydratase [Methylophilaceae bacterium]MBL6728431.1 tRNA threonylcarbamoyladenosine dehydratase [Methylophilaceae bacterium]MBL6790826.1 tRNA threonylcarbamoyladenosine dehydratase [Methylophilaceae bacterium]MBL6879861.1 tRNA threonylcarbamoyladenosine dehydratase [Burkholderiales bacterium]
MDKLRRFSGIIRLYGQDKFDKFQQSHVCVIGIGGVGSWAVESLARHGIGEITLIDFDHIAESNINRQIHALESTLGASKIQVMQQRIIEINPQIKVNCVDDFLSLENMSQLIDSNYDFVLDAIDQVKVKIELIKFCQINKIPVITTGGAGGRSDPSKIKLDSLKNTHGDRLISKVRQHFNQNKLKSNVPTVFSAEPIKRSEVCKNDHMTSGLSCDGYGSSTNITASFALLATAYILEHL